MTTEIEFSRKNPEECHTLVQASLAKHRRRRRQDDTQIPTATHGIKWPACKDFTIELGQELIEQYMKTWKLGPRWYHSLDFLFTTEEEFITFHHYRACYSAVTKERPIQGTAGVYFAVEISKRRPQSLPIEVYFVMESEKLLHVPGKHKFVERWLDDIIESKCLVRNMVKI